MTSKENSPEPTLTGWSNGFYFALDDYLHPIEDGELLGGAQIVPQFRDTPLPCVLVNIVVGYCVRGVMVKRTQRPVVSAHFSNYAMDMFSTRTPLHEILELQYPNALEMQQFVLGFSLGRLLLPPGLVERWNSYPVLVGSAGSGKSSWLYVLHHIPQDIQWY